MIKYSGSENGLNELSAISRLILDKISRFRGWVKLGLSVVSRLKYQGSLDGLKGMSTAVSRLILDKIKALSSQQQSGWQ